MPDIWLSGLSFCFWVNVPMAVDRSHRTSQSSPCWNSHFLIDRSAAYRDDCCAYIRLQICVLLCYAVFKNSAIKFQTFCIHERKLFLMLNHALLNCTRVIFSMGIWMQPVDMWMCLQLCSQMYAGSAAQERDRKRDRWIFFFFFLSQLSYSIQVGRRYSRGIPFD